MVRTISFVASCLLAYIVGTSAAPANNTNGILQVSVNDILSAPAILAPLADPSFEPIDGGSNATLVAAVPQFAAQVKNLESIKSSISAALATATGSTPAVVEPTTKPIAPSPQPTGLTKRLVPTNIDCIDKPSNPVVPYYIWQAAINRACHKFFERGPSLVYLLEGSTQSVTVGPDNHQFQFEYHVRSVPCTVYFNWVFYSVDKCIADLEARMFAAMAPDAAGLPTFNGLCFWTSGLSSEPDTTNAVWYKITSPSQ